MPGVGRTWITTRIVPTLAEWMGAIGERVD
jgi:hypothetical protein